MCAVVGEQKRVRIAELCGMYPEHWNEAGIRIMCDYLNDLNAMHAAEATLNAVQKQRYIKILMDESTEAVGVSEYEVCAFATASQRADAFIQLFA